MTPYNTCDMVGAWQFDYYNAKVAALIEAWPPGVLASFQRIARSMQEHGPDLGLPHTRAMGGGLFEVRAKGREGIGRAFYCTVAGQRIVILHAIVKKTEQTPPRELATARARMKEVKA
ncbi:MAG: type II toxin-antitoxin system RelE/ParE family toxin [Rhodanobacteraceae bacterium]